MKLNKRRKTVKKFYSILLIVAMMLTMLPPVTLAGTHTDALLAVVSWFAGY